MLNQKSAATVRASQPTVIINDAASNTSNAAAPFAARSNALPQQLKTTAQLEKLQDSLELDHTPTSPDLMRHQRLSGPLSAQAIRVASGSAVN